MPIIIDSTDKRMTVPVIDYLVNLGYEVHGICFVNETPLNAKKLKKVHYVHKNTVFNELKAVFLDYNQEDILIAGNPTIIETVNRLKPNCKYLLPSLESIDKASNKRELQLIADSLGINTPKELSEPSFPIIVKLNVSEKVTLKPSERYRIIKNESNFAAAESFMKENEGNLIMQKYVEGASSGVSMLLDEHSNLVDYIVHERLLEYPISGGPSAACKSIENTDLAKTAYTLLKALNWKGIAMVEFKGDYLIEINPRFWGSMPLLFVAGSDFFTNYVKILQNQHIVINPNDIKYEPSKVMFFFPQGLLSVIGLLKAKKVSKALNGIKTLIHGKEGIFRFKNPRPFFKYLILLVNRNSH